jgi:hypothetical protein
MQILLSPVTEADETHWIIALISSSEKIFTDDLWEWSRRNCKLVSQYEAKPLRIGQLPVTCTSSTCIAWESKEFNATSVLRPANEVDLLVSLVVRIVRFFIVTIVTKWQQMDQERECLSIHRISIVLLVLPAPSIPCYYPFRLPMSEYQNITGTTHWPNQAPNTEISNVGGAGLRSLVKACQAADMLTPTIGASDEFHSNSAAWLIFSPRGGRDLKLDISDGESELKPKVAVHRRFQDNRDHHCGGGYCSVLDVQDEDYVTVCKAFKQIGERFNRFIWLWVGTRTGWVHIKLLIRNTSVLIYIFWFHATVIYVCLRFIALYNTVQRYQGETWCGIARKRARSLVILFVPDNVSVMRLHESYFSQP